MDYQRENKLSTKWTQQTPEELAVKIKPNLTTNKWNKVYIVFYDDSNRMCPDQTWTFLVKLARNNNERFMQWK